MRKENEEVKMDDHDDIYEGYEDRLMEATEIGGDLGVAVSKAKKPTTSTAKKSAAPKKSAAAKKSAAPKKSAAAKKSAASKEPVTVGSAGMKRKGQQDVDVDEEAAAGTKKNPARMAKKIQLSVSE